MTIDEIIAMQKRQCDADKEARARKGPPPKVQQAPAVPKKMTPDEIARAYLEDRTYDGKTPEGDIGTIMRKENPDEYVARDGTRTFVPWRYVSIQDLELPDNGNPYRKSEDRENDKKSYDPWGRPSGYVGSAAGIGGVPPEYDPWSNPAGNVQSLATQAPSPNASWDDWLAPTMPAMPPTGVEPAQESGMNMGALDLMRAMR